MIESPSDNRRWLAVLVCVVAMGSAFRLMQWGAGLNFWGDEILLLVNVLGHDSVRLLTGPLDTVAGNLQVSPPLFLLWLKLTSQWCGTGERVLRLLPQLCSLGSLVGFAVLARRHLSWPSAVVVVAIFAGSNELVYQSGNLKQYSGDVLGAVVLLLAAGDPLKITSRRWWLFVLTGAVSVWFSHTAIFVWLGIAAGVATVATRGRLWPVLIAGAAVVIASFGTMYVVSAHRQSGGVLTTFWLENGAFPDYRSVGGVAGYVFNLPFVLYDRIRKPVSVVLVLPACIGLWSLWRRREPGLLLAWWLPAAINFVLAMLWLYPMAGSRICIYLMPGLLLLCGRGFDAALHWFTGSNLIRLSGTVIWLTCVVTAFVAIGTSVARLGGQPVCRGQVGKPAQFAAVHRTAEEAVLVPTSTQQLEAQFYVPELPTTVYSSDAVRLVPHWYIRGYTPGNAQVGAAPLAELQQRFHADRRFTCYGGEAWYLTPIQK